MLRVRFCCSVAVGDSGRNDTISVTSDTGDTNHYYDVVDEEKEVSDTKYVKFWLSACVDNEVLSSMHKYTISK